MKLTKQAVFGYRARTETTLIYESYEAYQAGRVRVSR